MHLRAVTFLAPGIPLRFYEVVCEHLARTLSCELSLVSETRSSGPMHGDQDPFGQGEADIGFLCSPSFLYLRSQLEPSVELVPAAFVFRDARHAGDEPVYYSDVVVRVEHPAESFDDLAGQTWGYNDECSLSGYFAPLQHLHQSGDSASFFSERKLTRSHQASIDSVLAGTIDAAAIDSTTLTLWRNERPELAKNLKVIASFGPFPIQPIVVRTGLGPDWAERLGRALLLEHTQTVASSLCDFGLQRFVPIDETAYAEERRQLCALGKLPRP